MKFLRAYIGRIGHNVRDDVEGGKRLIFTKKSSLINFIKISNSI